MDTLIAVHVLAHIQSLVEDLATNAAITLDGNFTFFFVKFVYRSSTMSICSHFLNRIFTGASSNSGESTATSNNGAVIFGDA